MEQSKKTKKETEKITASQPMATEASTITKNAESTPKRDIPPIVGIGASAGGLEALELFLRNVPNESGLAYVVIQHQDPDHKGMLPELLQRVTDMTVTPIRNRMKVKKNCVFVIPPNKDLSIQNGTLHLSDPVAPRGLRLPIDSFLRALAEDRRERAIGVILSGMGSDGTLGLRAIKERAGLTLVQEPSSAKFDGMPRSAISAGLADIVGPPIDLPEKICTYLSTIRSEHREKKALPGKEASVLEQILMLLYDRTGNDFSLYKKATMHRRIERRRSLHKIATLDGYVRYLSENPKEVDLLFKELLIGVTSFFRDAPVWEQLRNETIPTLLAAHPSGKVFRAWVPACSTGEEAYSLAMVFKEVLEQVKPKARFSLKIFATDLDQDAIDKARQGRYPANIAADVSAERLKRYFIEEGNGYRIDAEIRETVVFAPQNIIMDPPFTKLDIIACRNLLIYLGTELQHKLIRLFHYALNPDGFLLLGTAESISTYTNLFRPVENKLRLFQRMETGSPRGIDFPTKHSPTLLNMPTELKTTNSPDTFQTQVDQFLLQHLSPAAVLVNNDGDIIYVNGRTGKYLEPAAGKANLNIYAMAREGLRYELASAFRAAHREHKTVNLNGLQVLLDNGETQTVNIVVQAIDKPPSLRGMVMITFSDVAPALAPVLKIEGKGGHHTTRDQELENAYAEIRKIREQMQTSKEELTSTNEELQSMNEELQSTNEELMTSKEEIQSLNEELQTVNAELESKVDELSNINSDLKNLLNSTEIATVFLDSALCVRRFTDQVTKIYKLIAGDVGRPLSDIVSDLDYKEMQDDAKEVLRTLVFMEKQVPARDGRWFKVRIMPYRTLENVIDGVVITFVDVTAFKILEQQHH